MMSNEEIKHDQEVVAEPTVLDPWALVDAVLAQDQDRVNALKRAAKHDINFTDNHG